MGPRPSPLLVLVLCLGQAIPMRKGILVLSSPLPAHVEHMAIQDPQYKTMEIGCEEGGECSGNRGVLPKPSIRAELGPVIPQGRPVTIVCRGPAWAKLFGLEEKDGISVLMDQKNLSQNGSHWTEARFHIDAVNESTAGSYWCLYHKGPSLSDWSERSELLELKVTGAPRVVTSTSLSPTKPPSTAGHMQMNSSDTKNNTPPGLSPEHLYILVGVCVAFLFCLLLLILLLFYRQHQKKRGPPSSKGEEPRPQERLSPTADITDSPADVATTVDALPEENGDMHGPSPAAGDPQEVTYAQLDQRALTRRAARAESP